MPDRIPAVVEVNVMGPPGHQGVDGDITPELQALHDETIAAAEAAEDAAARTAQDASTAQSAADTAEGYAADAGLAAGLRFEPDKPTGHANAADGQIYTVAEVPGSGRFITNYKRVNSTIANDLTLTSLSDASVVEAKADRGEVELRGRLFIGDPFWATVYLADADIGGNVVHGTDVYAYTWGHFKGDFYGTANRVSPDEMLDENFRWGIRSGDGGADAGLLLLGVTDRGVGYIGAQPEDNWQAYIKSGQVWLWCERLGERQLTHDAATTFVAAERNGIALDVLGFANVGGAAVSRRLYFDGTVSYDATITEIAALFGGGQSNHLGTSPGIVISTPANPGRVGMFNMGIKIHGDANGSQDVAKLVPDGHRINIVDAHEALWANVGEGPMSSIGQQMCRAGGIASNAGVFVVDDSIGGEAINFVNKGNAAYQNRIDNAWRMYFLALTHGITVPFAGVDYDGHEGNINALAGEYRALLEDFSTDLLEDMAPIFGLARIPIVYQQTSNQNVGGGTSRPIVQDQLQAMLANPGAIYCVGPKYIYPTEADGVHITWQSQNHAGALRGRVWKALYNGYVWDGIVANPFACYVKTAVRAGSVITATCNVPVKPLVRDTSWVSDPGNYGITFEQTGGTAVTVTAVDVLDEGVNTDKIRVTLSGTPSGTAQKLGIAYYGTSGAHGGPTTGARACFRDSSPDIAINTSLNGGKLHNYVCHQLIGVT